MLILCNSTDEIWVFFLARAHARVCLLIWVCWSRRNGRIFEDNALVVKLMWEITGSLCFRFWRCFYWLSPQTIGSKCSVHGENKHLEAVLLSEIFILNGCFLANSGSLGIVGFFSDHLETFNCFTWGWLRFSLCFGFPGKSSILVYFIFSCGYLGCFLDLYEWAEDCIKMHEDYAYFFVELSDIFFFLLVSNENMKVSHVINCPKVVWSSSLGSFYHLC